MTEQFVYKIGRRNGVALYFLCREPIHYSVGINAHICYWNQFDYYWLKGGRNHEFETEKTGILQSKNFFQVVLRDMFNLIFKTHLQGEDRQQAAE